MTENTQSNSTSVSQERVAELAEKWKAPDAPRHGVAAADAHGDARQEPSTNLDGNHESALLRGPVPLGATLYYALSHADASAINHRRLYNAKRTEHGHVVGMHHVGNTAFVGALCPMVVVKVNDQHGSVNGQVLLDGNDVLWVTDVQHGTGAGQYQIPGVSY